MNFSLLSGKNLNVCKLKSILHAVRQKTYVFLPLWKLVLVLCFVHALVPDFRLQVERMDFKNRTDPDKCRWCSYCCSCLCQQEAGKQISILFMILVATEVFEQRVTDTGERMIESFRKLIILDIQALGNNGHKNMTEAIKDAMEKVYVKLDAPGLDRHPKSYLDFPYVSLLWHMNSSLSYLHTCIY